MPANLLSRFTIQDYPHAAPGKCVLCGANHVRDGRKYVDFGMDVPRYGAVYMCTKCIDELAHLLDYFNPREAKQLESDARLARQQLSEEMKQNERLRIALSNLDFLGSIGAGIPGNIPPPQGKDPDDIGSKPEQGANTQGTNNEPKHPSKRRKVGEEGPIESPDVRGLAHLLNPEPPSGLSGAF